MSSSFEELEVGPYSGSSSEESEVGRYSESSDSSTDERDNRRPRIMFAAYQAFFQVPRPMRRRSIKRNRDVALQRLMEDYFNDDHVYTLRQFRDRFRMRRGLFLRIVNDVQHHHHYFQEGYDARGRRSFIAIQKCTSAMRQLAYGSVPDQGDDYLMMSARTSREWLSKFCEAIHWIYVREYLRRPTRSDVRALYTHHATVHRFSGMLGSIDCTKWEWRNCPTAWRGQFMRGDGHHPNIMPEAIASQDTWFWHDFFGVAGSNNDLNVQRQSPLFDHVLHGLAPRAPFIVNENRYEHGYYLGDGMYPNEATFVKAFPYPIDAKRVRFKKAQEAARKDIERAFGILKAQFALVRLPARPTRPSRIRKLMYACLILHSMILQDEGKAICTFHLEELPEGEGSHENYDRIFREIHDQPTYYELRSDLVEHISRTRIPRFDR